MEKTNKFVDPMDKLFAPPPNRSKWDAFKTFIYDSEKGAFLGRTPSSWVRITTFYIIFYAILAGFFAVCIWGLLQSISDDRPTYQLDESIIGSSPGLASRPLPPEGRDSIMTFNINNTWSNSEWPAMLGNFFDEYKDSSTGHMCTFTGKNQLPCQVDTSLWGNCIPDGKQLNAPCIYFKINKVLEWTPKYYTDVNKLPSEMPDSLKKVIQGTSETERQMVWLSCEGKNKADKEKVGPISFYPKQGFPGYYFPFRRQTNYKSPVVAIHFQNPDNSTVIDVECRAWAPNIIQDRKEQLGVLNFKLKFNN